MIHDPITTTTRPARRAMPAEVFDAWSVTDEGARYEWMEGEAIPMVSSNQSSQLALTIGSLLNGWIRQHRLGKATGPDGGYLVNGQRFMPDFAFVQAARLLPDVPKTIAWYPIAPDLAVEVLSPSDALRDVARKLQHYMLAGTTVWVIDPDQRGADVYSPGQSPQTYAADGVLTGEGVLAGFQLPLASLWED
jgi:Uma2 family endonuclease